MTRTAKFSTIVLSALLFAPMAFAALAEAAHIVA